MTLAAGALSRCPKRNGNSEPLLCGKCRTCAKQCKNAQQKKMCKTLLQRAHIRSGCLSFAIPYV